MRRRIIDLWERIYYLYSLRGEYFHIQYRYYLRRTNGWKSLKPLRNWLLLALTATVAIIGLISGYAQPWTGFAAHSDPAGGLYPGKTLWDWMDLLLIPALLAVLAYFFTRRQAQRETATALLNKREQALQQYLEYMTHLLIDNAYADEDTAEEARRLARARTITVLEMLDGPQKGHLIRFLVEAELIDREMPAIKMDRANLQRLELNPGPYRQCNLHGANLDGAKLPWCSLSGSDLGSTSIRGADLESVDLSSANLNYALLTRSDLYSAKLIETELIKAHLEDADLQRADLRRATLRTAKMKGANFRRANLAGAYMRFADLRFANLRDADLTGADLTEANFYGANLTNAVLTDADLSKAFLSKRQFRSAKSTDRAWLPAGARL